MQDSFDLRACGNINKDFIEYIKRSYRAGYNGGEYITRKDRKKIAIECANKLNIILKDIEFNLQKLGDIDLKWCQRFTKFSSEIVNCLTITIKWRILSSSSYIYIELDKCGDIFKYSMRKYNGGDVTFEDDEFYNINWRSLRDSICRACNMFNINDVIKYCDKDTILKMHAILDEHVCSTYGI